MLYWYNPMHKLMTDTHVIICIYRISHRHPPPWGSNPELLRVSRALDHQATEVFKVVV